MNCDEVQDLLPLHLYGDLTDTERAVVEGHLSGCPGCRSEFAALQVVRKGLDAALPKLPQVDVGAIHRVETDRLRRRSRRWRAVAILAATAAALLLVVRLEVRADGRQLTMRWGAPEPVIAPTVIERTVVVRSEPASSRELEERVKRVSELIEAIIVNVDEKNGEQRKELAHLQRELADLQQIKKRLGQTEREVSALYTAQFGSRPSGVNP